MRIRGWWLAWGCAALLISVTGAYGQEGNRLQELLTATPWCSFKYNKVTGYSNTTRYQFFNNGTYFSGGASEGYSSGSGGTFSSQRNKQSGGNWRLHGNALYVTINGVVQEPAFLTVKMNSNGTPIIMADGMEFSPCR